MTAFIYIVIGLLVGFDEYFEARDEDLDPVNSVVAAAVLGIFWPLITGWRYASSLWGRFL